tara:strand:+ start:2156 stop:2293 length:138 start_codon:yes stop_codon:yes gene_type:complete
MILGFLTALSGGVIAGRKLDIAPDRVLKGPMIAMARIIGLSIGKV